MPDPRSPRLLLSATCCLLLAAVAGTATAQSLQRRTELDTGHLGEFLVDTKWVHFAADASYLLFRESDALIAAPLSLDGSVGDRLEVLAAPRRATILAYDVVRRDDGLVVYVVSRPTSRLLSVDSYRLDRRLRTVGRSRRLGRLRVRASSADVRVRVHDDDTAVVIDTRNVPRAAAPDPDLGSLFFLVTDARGQQRRRIHDLTPEREPNISSDIAADAPLWSGSRWLIPVVHRLVYAYRAPTSPRALITFHFDAEVEVVDVTDADSRNPRVRRRVLFKPPVFSSQDTYRLFFLSDGDAGGANPGPFRLLLQHTRATDFAASYETHRADYRIFSVDSAGDPADGVRTPRIPRFRHGIPYREGTLVGGFGETVTPARVADGSLLLLMTRSLNVTDRETNELVAGIHRLRVFAYNDGNARVRRRSATTIDEGAGVETSKQVNVIDGELYALGGRFITEDTETTTTFKTVFFLERFGR